MRVVFRLDYGEFVGLGHLARCSALAGQLEAAGHKVFFLVRFHKSDKLEKTPDMLGQITLIALTPFSKSRTASPSTWLGVSQELDSQETSLVAKQLGADLVILDHYGARDAWISSWNRVLPILQISDSGAIPGVDYILDYGFDASSEKHRHALQGSTILLAGPVFAPVSAEYKMFSLPPRSDGSKLPKVLVSLGGSAAPEHWYKVYSALKSKLSLGEFEFIGGDVALSRVVGLHPNIKVNQSMRGLMAPLQKADFAILSAGVSMYEMMASGRPGIILATVENQMPSFSAARKGNFIQGYEINSFNSQDAALFNIQDYSDGSREIDWLKYRSLVDNFGALRVLAALGLNADEEPKLRPMGTADLPFLLRLVNQESVLTSSFSRARVTPKQHLDWAEASGSSRRIWIFELGDLPVGQCRLEALEKGFILDYSVDENFQGKGIAKLMLKALIKEVGSKTPLMAKVRPSNQASLSVLFSAGFVVTEHSEKCTTLERGESFE